MTRLRTWAWVVGLFALTTAAVAACALDRPASTWEELERIVSTYPVPTGFTVTAPERKGELCRRPDCATPGVALRMAPPKSLASAELCPILQQSLRDWDGFTLADRQTAETDGCSIDGRVEGKKVNAFVARPQTAAERAQGTVVIVSVWA